MLGLKVIYVKRARWGGYLGLSLMPLAFLVMGSFSELEQLSLRGILGLLALGFSLSLMDWGIWNYAKSKGYGNCVACLSLLNVYGLIILVFLPHKSND